jgi:hypothetical protein
MSIHTKAGIQFAIGVALLIVTFASEGHGFTSMQGSEAIGFNSVAVVKYGLGFLLLILAFRNLRRLNTKDK